MPAARPTNKMQRQRTWLLQLCGAILVATAVAKLVGSFGTSKILAESDPIFGVSNVLLLRTIAAVEVIVAICCFLMKNSRLCAALVVWFSINVGLYRCGLWWIDYRKPCTCLGTLFESVGVDDKTADHIMLAILASLLICSLAALRVDRRAENSSAS